MSFGTRLRSAFQFGKQGPSTSTGDAERDSQSSSKSGRRDEDLVTNGDVPALQPGELSFDEDTRGGMGRHLGLFSTTFLM